MSAEKHKCSSKNVANASEEFGVAAKAKINIIGIQMALICMAFQISWIREVASTHGFVGVGTLKSLRNKSAGIKKIIGMAPVIVKMARLSNDAYVISQPPPRNPMMDPVNRSIQHFVCIPPFTVSSFMRSTTSASAITSVTIIPKTDNIKSKQRSSRSGGGRSPSSSHDIEHTMLPMII